MKCLSSHSFPIEITHLIGRRGQMNTVSKQKGTMGNLINYSTILKAYDLSEMLCLN